MQQGLWPTMAAAANLTAALFVLPEIVVCIVPLPANTSAPHCTRCMKLTFYPNDITVAVQCPHVSKQNVACIPKQRNTCPLAPGACKVPPSLQQVRTSFDKQIWPTATPADTKGGRPLQQPAKTAAAATAAKSVTHAAILRLLVVGGENCHQAEFFFLWHLLPLPLLPEYWQFMV